MKRIATADSIPLPPPSAACWQAQLDLGFSADGTATRLVRREHRGPLRVQKPLYPEGGAVCHAIVVHPPGGVVGGDELTIRVDSGAGSAAFISTPGAAKWYKANGRVSRQRVELTVAENATLEWMPQETIIFDAAHVQLDHSVTLGENASYIGCDILCFGRTAFGERFSTGQVTQRSRIRRNGSLVWFEQGTIAAGTGAAGSPLGLAGKTVCATLIAVGSPVPAALVARLRETDMRGFGVTQMKSVVVVRYLGDSSEQARQLMMRAWQELRPVLTGRAAVPPRIWNT